MAKPKPVWEVFKGRYSAGGDRNVLIVASIGEVNIDSPDVVPRSAVELTEDNRRKLTNQGVPEECCDDLSIIKARINLDKTYHLVGTEVSEPGNELSRSYILGRIADLMKQNNKPGGEFLRSQYAVYAHSPVYCSAVSLSPHLLLWSWKEEHR